MTRRTSCARAGLAAGAARGCTADGPGPGLAWPGRRRALRRRAARPAGRRPARPGRYDESGGVVRRQEAGSSSARCCRLLVAGYEHRARRCACFRAGGSVSGDPDARRTVAVNLIDNALRYAATSVEVALGPGSVGDLPTAVTTVTDDGPGNPAARARAGIRPLLPGRGLPVARVRRHRPGTTDRARHRPRPRRQRASHRSGTPARACARWWCPADQPAQPPRQPVPAARSGR